MMFPCILLLSGCGRYYVEVYEQHVDETYLASTAVRSPDPRAFHPPCGQMIVIEWQVPLELLGEHLFVEFDANFLDHTHRRYVFPVNERRGFVTLRILDDEFVETGGVFAYVAKIKTEEGVVFRKWQHQLWVNLITTENNL